MTIIRFALVFLACIAWEAPIASSADDPNSAEVSELAYFAASDGWGDPDKQGRFRNIKISETSFTTVNGQYSSLIEVIETEKLASLEGVGIFFENYFSDEERENFTALLTKNGVSDIITNRDDAWSAAVYGHCSAIAG